MERVKAHQKSPERITFDTLGSPKVDYSKIFNPIGVNNDGAMSNKHDMLKNKDTGTRTSVYVNPNEPKTIQTTNRTFSYLYPKKSGSLGGGAV